MFVRSFGLFFMTLTGVMAIAVACDVGAYDPDPQTDLTAGPDAGPAPVEPSPPQSQFACDDRVGPNGDGEHNPGTACLQCHNPQDDEAPAFTIGGTLYTDDIGTAPLAGATIHLIDATGKDIALVTSQNGNFWTSEQLVFPVKTYATACPDVAEMFTPVDQAAGDCNVGGCHDADFRVSLPLR